MDAEQKKKKGQKRWFVMLGGHVTLFVFGGSYRTFGVFLIAWREYFGSSAAEISAIMTILAASGLFTGFMSGPFITRFGCHNSILLGGIFIVVGSIVSAFAPSPLVLCFTTGLMWGSGIGFVRNAGQIVVAGYFDKGYSRANSFVSAGVAIGIMVCPPLLQLCIEQYGWRGTFIIFSAIQAHVIVAGLIARPQRGTTRKTSRQGRGGQSRDVLLALGNKSETGRKDSSDSICFGEAHLAEDYKANMEESPGNQMNIDVGNSGGTKSNGSSAANIGESEGHSSQHDPLMSVDNNEARNLCVGDACCSERPLPAGSCRADDALESRGKPRNSNCANSAGDCDRPDAICGSSTSPCSDLVRPQKLPWWHRLLRSSGFTLFAESVGFRLFQVCQVSFGIAYTAMTTHLVASAVYSGIDAQRAAFLITGLGIASMMARFLVGWFIDLKVIMVDHMFVLVMSVFGGSVLLTRASDTFGWYLFNAILLGASSGTFKCLVPVLLRKYVGVKNLAPAMGMCNIFIGIGDLLGPIVAGALYDASNNYDVPFFVTGSILVATSFLLLLEPPLRRRKEKQESKMADRCSQEAREGKSNGSGSV